MIKICILDDDPKDRFITEKAISVFGVDADISHSNSPQEFLDKHWHDAPDVLIIDVNLGTENGHEFAAQLKAFPQFKHTQIKMVSGFITAASQQYRCAHSLGDVIVKPMRRKDYVPFVKSIFGLNAIGLRRMPELVAA